MIITLNAEKPLDKIQEPYMIKCFGEISDTGIYLNTIKTKYSKLNSTIKLWIELKAVPLKLGMNQDCPFSQYLFNVVLEVLARAIVKSKKY